MTNNKLLKERGSVYGDIGTVSTISQNIKDEFYLNLSLNSEPKYKEINAIIMECSEMIIHKLSRIASGNPYYIDNVRDIAGYAQLMLNKLSKFEDAIDNKCEKFKIENNSKTWIEKCLDCKYCNHISAPEKNINFYVCGHLSNLKNYQECKDIWKECKYKKVISK